MEAIFKRERDQIIIFEQKIKQKLWKNGKERAPGENLNFELETEQKIHIEGIQEEKSDLVASASSALCF